jgi:hypothetical protein
MNSGFHSLALITVIPDMILSKSYKTCSFHRLKCTIEPKRETNLFNIKIDGLLLLLLLNT